MRLFGTLSRQPSSIVLLAAHQADPGIDAIQLDGFVAGDDGAVKQRDLE